MRLKMKWLCLYLLSVVILSDAETVFGQSANPFTQLVEASRAGEYPLFCGINYHSAMPMIDEGASMGFVFPDPIPVELATPLHVLKWTKLPATTELFALWLATKAQPLVEKYSYRGAPWDPNSRKFPLAKGKYIAVCGVDCLLKKDEYFAEHSQILKLPGVK